LVLMTAAMVVPAATSWDVRIGFPPVFAHWMPRVGPGSAPAVMVAVLGLAYADRISMRLSWLHLIVVTWLTSLAWLASLALVDGRAGLSSHIDTDDLLQVARHTASVSALLHGFVTRIPLGPDGWPTHVAGHPPGALLFFVVLVRLGLGGSLAVGLVVTLLASTIPIAVLTTVRVLGAEHSARLAAPFLVLAPAAIWEAVSGDAVYAAVAAWGLLALAMATRSHLVPWSLASGLLLGSCVMMSYGLPLLGLLAMAILVAARSYRPILPTAAAALAVVAAFWVAGFSLWDAYPAIHQRYWAGVASVRPASYWLWGDLAALGFSAGPALGAAVGCWLSQVRRYAGSWHSVSQRRVVGLLGGGAIAAVVAADLSLMSKAEVERIWLPFVPWLLLMCALLPSRWRRPALAVQLVSALVVQQFFVTGW
jgi:methylthioxylose transferase